MIEQLCYIGVGIVVWYHILVSLVGVGLAIYMIHKVQTNLFPIGK